MASKHQTPLLVVSLTLILFSGCIAAGAPQDAEPTPPSATHPANPTGFDLQGTGWVAHDVTADAPLELTFTFTHDTMDDLCTFSDDGEGVYDQGHHSVVLLFRLGDDPLVEGHWFLWSGTPYNSFWPRQSGECGASETLALEAGETARLVVATSVAGFHIDLAVDGEAPVERTPLAATARPDHAQVFPEATAVVSASQTPATVAVAHEWRTGFELDSPALLFTKVWSHSGAGMLGGGSAYARATLLDVDFEGATPYAPVPHELPAYPSWGFGSGLSTDGTSLFPALATDPGHVEAYAHEVVSAVAHTGLYDRGAHMLSVPLGTGA